MLSPPTSGGRSGRVVLIAKLERYCPKRSVLAAAPLEAEACAEAGCTTLGETALAETALAENAGTVRWGAAVGISNLGRAAPASVTAGISGNVTTNRVPDPTSLSTSISPLCSFTIPY